MLPGKLYAKDLVIIMDDDGDGDDDVDYPHSPKTGRVVGVGVVGMVGMVNAIQQRSLLTSVSKY